MTGGSEGSLTTLMGFDYGTRSIGVAIGQQLTGTAHGLTTVHVRDGRPDWDAVTRLLDEWRPGALVVGLPLNMDGTEHELTHAARRFGNQLSGRYNLPVHLVDERLTSIEAERILAETEGGRIVKEDIDKLAAQLILETWLGEHAPPNHEDTR